ncbi:hypothetical protein ABWH96_13120 [Marivirga tractuosa]|uniref:hypothetical protein n=1 Tax=Marivirga tractuosa TaxID=1006 RepID=UPI0035CE8D30
MAQKILLLLSTCIMGVFLGTQLAEAVLIVPYWKELSSDAFFELHKTYGKRLYQFYAPLTIASIILPTITFFYSLLGKSKTDILLWVMFISAIMFFSTYFIYFKEANISFAEQTITNEALSKELIRWGNWHWTRVLCEAIAFVCGLILLLKTKWKS